MISPRLLAALALIFTLTAGALLWRSEQRRAAAEDRLAALLRDQTARPLPPAPVSNAPVASEPAASTRSGVSRREIDLSPYLKRIDELQQKIQELDRDLLASQSAQNQAQGRLADLNEAAQKSEAQLRDLREDADKNRRLAEVLDAELKAKSQRLVQAETTEKLMQQRVEKAELAARRAASTARGSEDINRRRELVLSSLLRRFREITEFCRSFSLQAQNRANAAAGLDAGDLSRLQTTLQQAEDDLEQLRSLNRLISNPPRVN
jgi:chromosome segregation ATPase